MRWRLQQPIRIYQLGLMLNSLAVLLRSGVSLVRSLEILSQQEPNERLRNVLGGLVRTVSTDGEAFSTACARYPRIFPESIVVLLKIGEAVGDLSGRLDDGRKMLERQQRMQDDIRRALIGPCMTLVACMLMLYVVVAFVMPRMSQLYDDMHVEMPLLSRIVLGAAHWLTSPVFTACAVAVGLLLVATWSRIVPHLVGLGLRLRWSRKVIGQCLATSFCSQVGHLYQDGVALSVALDVLVNSTSLPVYSPLLRQALEKFRASGDMAAALDKIPFFPRTVTSMMRIGQETGQIDTMLLALSRILEEENQDLFNRLVTLLEPAMMVVFGIILCVLFVGLFIPIYGVLSHLQV